MNAGAPSWSHCKTLTGLGVLLLQLTASAQTQTPVQACLQGALQHYEAFRYERALKRLNGCALLDARTEEETVSLLLYKGILFAELRQQEEASRAFQEALSLRPEAVLPIMVSPKISLQFEHIGAALAVTTPEARWRPARPEPGTGPRASPSAPPPRKPPLAAASTPPSADSARAPKDLRTIWIPSKPTSLPVDVSQMNSEEVEAPSLPPRLKGLAKDTEAAQVQQSEASSPQAEFPATLGDALALVGSAFWSLTKQDDSRLESNDPRLQTAGEAADTASCGSSYRKMGFGLEGANFEGLDLPRHRGMR